MYEWRWMLIRSCIVSMREPLASAWGLRRLFTYQPWASHSIVNYFEFRLFLAIVVYCWGVNATTISFQLQIAASHPMTAMCNCATLIERFTIHNADTVRHRLWPKINAAIFLSTMIIYASNAHTQHTAYNTE